MTQKRFVNYSCALLHRSNSLWSFFLNECIYISLTYDYRSPAANKLLATSSWVPGDHGRRQYQKEVCEYRNNLFLLYIHWPTKLELSHCPLLFESISSSLYAILEGHLVDECIDYRCEDCCFLVSGNCVTFFKPWLTFQQQNGLIFEQYAERSTLK